MNNDLEPKVVSGTCLKSRTQEAEEGQPWLQSEILLKMEEEKGREGRREERVCGGGNS